MASRLTDKEIHVIQSIAAGFGLFVLSFASCAGSALAADYRIVREFAIPGAGGWDYLTYDAKNDRLFIARNDRVQVVDPLDGRLLGEVADTAGVHGVALVPALGKGYTSNGRAGAIGVFDVETLKTTATIATPEGRNPDFILYDDHSRRIVAFNGSSANATVVRVADDRIVGTIALPGKPEASASDLRGTVFVAIEDRDEVASIDLARGEVIGTMSLPGCHEPAGLALDPETRRLFVGCHNETLVVVDIDAGRVIATLPIGKGVDATVFDPLTKLIFSSQGDGTLTIIRETSAERFDLVENVRTVAGARTMALNPKTHEIYLVSAEFDDVPPSQGAPRRRIVRPGTFRLTVLAPH